MLVQLKNCQSKYQGPGSIVRILSPKVQARKNIQRKLTLKNYKKKRYKKENILSLMINKNEPAPDKPVVGAASPANRTPDASSV